MNWVLYAILGVALMGASPVLAKAGMHKSNSHLAAALRGTFLFLGAWMMLGFSGAGMNFSTIGSKTFLYLIFSGIATGLVWMCLIRALQLGEVIKAIPILEGSIILNLLVEIIFTQNGKNWNNIIILVILIAGTFMMGLKGSGRGGKRGAWLGYAFGAMVLTSVTVLLDQIGISGVDAYQERFVRYGVALIFVWLVVFATKGYKGLRSISFVDGIYLCLSGVVMGGAWYCFHWARVLGVFETVELIEQFDLVAAVVLGCVFMRERLTVRAIFGMVFMMVGFWLLLANWPIIPF